MVVVAGISSAADPRDCAGHEHVARVHHHVEGRLRDVDLDVRHPGEARLGRVDRQLDPVALGRGRGREAAILAGRRWPLNGRGGVRARQIGARDAAWRERRAAEASRLGREREESHEREPQQ